jgi:hypothetical protein
MKRDARKQIASHCPCGSPLRWETRETYGERRSLALCSNADCGLVTTASQETVQSEQGLEAFLLGRVPPRPCLSCGATGVAWWLGAERTAIAMDGSEWDEPSTAVLILKRVLEERGAMAAEARPRDFLN